MSEGSDGATQGWLWGRYSGLGLWVALLTLVADQLHKWWMLHVFHIGERGRVTLTPFLDLVLAINKGVSYGLLDRAGPWALTAFAGIATLALWIWLAHAGSNRLMAWSLGLIIGGALGNALDRIFLGGVADFFSLHAFGFYWYVFNIADIAIVAGVIGLLYESLWLSRNDASKTA